jgi:hypothetical protein
MIRGYIRTTSRNICKTLRLFFWKVDLDSLFILRYKVLSDLGEQQLEDILRRMKDNRKKVGHNDYWNAVRENHLVFFKDDYDSKRA